MCTDKGGMGFKAPFAGYTARKLTKDRLEHQQKTFLERGYTMAIKTIEDSKGNVWTGKEVSNSSLTDAAWAVATAGLSELIPRDTSVEVNGERHSGREIDSKRR